MLCPHCATDDGCTACMRDDACKSCAFTLGTVPNGCGQTQLDALKAVVEGGRFLCHAPMDGRMCSGFACARAEHVANPLPAEVQRLARKWEYSPPDDVVATGGAQS